MIANQSIAFVEDKRREVIKGARPALGPGCGRFIIPSYKRPDGEGWLTFNRVLMNDAISREENTVHFLFIWKVMVAARTVRVGQLACALCYCTYDLLTTLLLY